MKLSNLRWPAHRGTHPADTLEFAFQIPLPRVIMMKRNLLTVLMLLVCLPAGAAAQGVQTGTITGTVTSSDGVALADAAVVLTSPALQGERTTLTDVNGVYSVPSLPPGTYTVRF